MREDCHFTSITEAQYTPIKAQAFTYRERCGQVHSTQAWGRQDGVVTLPTQMRGSSAIGEEPTLPGLRGHVARTELSLPHVQVRVRVDTTRSTPGEKISARLPQLPALRAQAALPAAQGVQHGLRVLSSSVLQADNCWHPANTTPVAVPQAAPCHLQMV